MAIKTFQRGSAVYKCNVCKRSTRNTGDEGNCRLCAECYELAGIENEISDNGPLPTEDLMSPENSRRTSVATVRHYLDRLVKHGIDVKSVWPEMVAITEGGR
jgi:hypothetical protein